jgi:thymidylate kinase
MLESLLETFNTTGLQYCILHGYKGYPENVPSDVDCIMRDDMVPHGLVRLLRANGFRVGGSIVQWLQHEATAHYFVLASKGQDEPPSFLKLDVSSDYRRNGRVFYSGHDILETRRWYRQFWVPMPAVEFGYYLVKKIAKGMLTEVHSERLSELFKQDPTGCEREITRFWGAASSQIIIAAAAGGNWEPVRSSIWPLRAELLKRTIVRYPVKTGSYWISEIGRKARRWWRPTGLHVVLLGADGSGKSTILEAVRESVAPAFRRTSTHHLSPALFRRRSQGGPVTDPHGQAPRSFAMSTIKAFYWLFDYTIGYHLKVRPELVRSTLVLFDRYLVDALVDPQRYRYGGSGSLLRVVWKLVPKPDLVILLDAPPEVIQSRKQEVVFQETARQCAAYRALVERMPNGHIVDAAQPLDKVVADVSNILIEFLAARTARRLGLETKR